MSMDYLKEKGKKVKKVLLVVTDGDDNTSAPSNTIEKLVAKAQQSQCLIYAIGIFTDEERGKAKRAERAMNALAKRHGRTCLLPEGVDGHRKSWPSKWHTKSATSTSSRIAPATRRSTGSYRRIQVVAKGPNRPVVRTRSGYYATPDNKEPTRLSPSAMSNSLKP
jgi:hypothetical protein